jgi:hypothetical protein
MAFVIADPQMLVAAARDLELIGSSVIAANAAAGPTTGIAAAAADEVSTAIAQDPWEFSHTFEEFDDH